MNIRRIAGAVVVALSAMASAPTLAAMPAITGTPVVDTPKLLQWPTDQGIKKPNLDDPAADSLWDFHGTIDTCDVVLLSHGAARYLAEVSRQVPGRSSS